MHTLCLDSERRQGDFGLDESNFSEAVRKIYAAAADFSLWGDALAAVEEFTGSAGSVLNVISKNNLNESYLLRGPRIYAHYDDAGLEEYNRDLLPHCPRVAGGLAHPEWKVSYDYMILSEAEMDRNIAYEWYGRHGLRYFIGAPIGETSKYTLMWSLQRSRKQGHASPEDIRLFELFHPHFCQALVLADRLGTLGSRWRLTVSLLDSVPQALFLLSADGELLFANAAGDRLLTEGDALQLSGSRLTARIHHENERLQQLIGDLLRSENASTPKGEWLRISRASGRMPYALFASRIAMHEFSPLSDPPAVLVVAHDPTARMAVDPTELRQLYGLTEMEARLAAALAAGHDLASASVLLAIRPTTARVHLKAVFRKMEVNRQQDVIRILAALGAGR
jgi:DNA-binding CsgD family transcriptional regulator/PAS domain-containing protein